MAKILVYQNNGGIWGLSHDGVTIFTPSKNGFEIIMNENNEFKRIDEIEIHNRLGELLVKLNEVQSSLLAWKAWEKIKNDKSWQEVKQLRESK